MALRTIRRGTPVLPTTRASSSSLLSSGSAVRADLTALITSQTSGPPARAALRPVGPSRKTTPGCSALRSPSSTRRLAAADSDSPGWEAAKDARRRATSVSNLTGVGDLRVIDYCVVDRRHLVMDALATPPWPLGLLSDAPTSRRTRSRAPRC